jgi:hypothetical protein
LAKEEAGFQPNTPCFLEALGIGNPGTELEKLMAEALKSKGSLEEV